ncbi:hypothetical protein M422DRAFT_150832, partial [Sphaerobolus stellatus SS14]
PTIFKLALDILLVQGSSVPAKCTFSSATESNTKCRSCIAPILMEELQLLKYYVKHTELDLTEKWGCNEENLEVENSFQDMAEG